VEQPLLREQPRMAHLLLAVGLEVARARPGRSDQNAPQPRCLAPTHLRDALATRNGTAIRYVGRNR
jgi:hypothetical protein